MTTTPSVLSVPLGVPVGSPPLPAGFRRASASGECSACTSATSAGSAVALSGAHPPTLVCAECVWEDLYTANGMPPPPDVWPWVSLGWEPRHVQAAIAAGVAPREAVGFDPTDGDVSAGWALLAGLRPTAEGA